MEELATRTCGGEASRLKRENERLRRELEELREDIRDMRKEMEEMRRLVGSSLPREQKEGDFKSTLGPEELKRSIDRTGGCETKRMGGKICPLSIGHGEATAGERGKECILQQSEGRCGGPQEEQEKDRGRKEVPKEGSRSERKNPTLADAGKEMTISWIEVVKKGKAKEESGWPRGRNQAFLRLFRRSLRVAKKS